MRLRTRGVLRFLSLAIVCSIKIIGVHGAGGGRASQEAEGVREALYGEGLLSTVEKAVKKEPSLAIAPVLFIGGSEARSQSLVSELFDYVREHSRQTEVTIAPFGDSEADERQAVAVVTTYEAEETITSGAFANVGRETALSFAFSTDVIYSVHVTDLLRGEIRFTLLQTALEQFLHFQDRSLISPDSPPKTLHMVVYGVDDKEADELGLRDALTSQLDAVWERLIKPSKLADKEEITDEGKAPFWSTALTLRPVFIPSPEYAESKHKSTISALKTMLDQKLMSQGPFVSAKTLEAAVAALQPVSKEFLSGAKSFPKEDTIISNFYLDKLVARYITQFRSDSRRLLEEMNTGYAEDFGKDFTDLIDKYLVDFHQGLYGADAGSTHISLQGLDSGSVAAVVRQKKQELRTALLAIAEEGYGRQLQFLKQMAQEEFRKVISTIKYQWQLVPGFAKAIKTARSLFIDQAKKVQCKGAKWNSNPDLRALTAVLETQANDAIERSRASGAFVPKNLRKPIGVQINWLGANFFHFLRDSSCDPLSIRTDTGVALWQSLGEVWSSRKGKDSNISRRYRQLYGPEIDPRVLDYLSVNPKGVSLTDKDPRLRFGWNKKLAYDLIRNHDDMTFQIPHAKGIASY